MLKESFLVFTSSYFCLPFFLELYEGTQRYTFPQSLYELKAQLGQQLAHAQTFDRGVALDSVSIANFPPANFKAAKRRSIFRLISDKRRRNIFLPCIIHDL